MRMHYTGEGYAYFRDRSFGEDNTVYVQQLVAIANGADPYRVFSGGVYQSHHKIPGYPWLNFPDNIELLHWEDHADIEPHVANISPASGHND